MIRYLIAVTCLSLSIGAQAQQMDHHHSPMMHHGAAAATGGHAHAARATEAGQAAFAAIQEVVSILEADPNTDWAKVDIEALRRHLVDMDNVTLRAEATAAPVENGMRFTVTGAGPVRHSIRRMVTAHAATMNGRDGWKFAAAEHPEGAILTVTVSRAADAAKLKGLGFIGIMTWGMHHQEHHLMIAAGKGPHH